MGTISIPEDDHARLGEVVAELMKNGLRFNVVVNPEGYLITVTGY